MRRIRETLRKVRNRFGSGPDFRTRDVRIGQHVKFGRNVVFNCRKVVIGDGTIIGNNVTVNADTFEIGDYGTIYDSCFFPGPGELRIGHNFWLGSSSIVDSQGGTTIGNNVGVGAHSQLWTHMKYGDVLYGCRFHTARTLDIEDDVWLVGHCLVSPVRIGTRCLVMLGSVITKNLEPDRCYAGVPAKDVTDKIGPQFEEKSITDRVSYLRQRVHEFAEWKGIPELVENIRIVSTTDEMRDIADDELVFNVADRTYRKCRAEIEFKLMRYLLPDAKFVPQD